MVKTLKKTGYRFKLELNSIKIIAGFCLIVMTMILSGFSMRAKWSDLFLHLEDVKTDTSLKELWNGSHYVLSSEEVLPVLHDFCSCLYEHVDLKTDSDIVQFLDKLELPSITMDASELTDEITSDEVEAVIKKLHPGKAPGIDGLTADFYTHFVDQLSDILALVYNTIFE